MPTIVQIPDKKLVVQFPDEMDTDQINEAIYTHIYGGKPQEIDPRFHPGIEESFRGPIETPSFADVTPEKRRSDTSLPAMTDYMAKRKTIYYPEHFDPEGEGYDYETAQKYGIQPDEKGHWPSLVAETGMLLKGRGHPTIDKTLAAEERLDRQLIKRDGRYYSIPKEREQKEPSGLDLLTEDLSEATGKIGAELKQYASYVPYLAVKAISAPIHYLAVPHKPGAPGDVETVLKTATDYWRKQIGDTVQIPNVGVGMDEKGKLRIQPREPIGFADLLGETAETMGAVAGPVRGAAGAGELLTQRLSQYARPFYRSILRGMITGALLGEGKKDETLQNMALFGTFEPLAYGLGRASEFPQKIKDSTMWRRMTIKERGLMLQSVDDMVQSGMSEAQIIRELRKRGIDTRFEEARAARMKPEGPEPPPFEPTGEGPKPPPKGPEPGAPPREETIPSEAPNPPPNPKTHGLIKITSLRKL